MKPILIFTLVFSFCHLSAQNLIAWEKHQGGNTYLVEIGVDTIHKIPTGNWFDGKMLPGNQLIGANAYRIYRQQGTQTNTLLDVRAHAAIPEIIALSVSEKLAVLATYDDLASFELRRSGMQLFTWDLTTGILKSITLPDSLNFSKLSLSNDGKHLAFVHLQNYHADPNKPLHDQAILMLFDFRSGELQQVDTADLEQESWYKGNFEWQDDHTLRFLKKESEQQKLALVAYDLKEGSKKLSQAMSPKNSKISHTAKG